MADNTDNDSSEGSWYLPQMGRARGIIDAFERVRNQGRGLRPNSSPMVGCGRARARALLLEVITRNPAQAHNPASCQTGKKGGQRSLSPPYPGRGVRARA